MTQILTRHSGLFFAFIAAAVLSTAYISQYFFNMPPCHLCLIQRVPYFMALALALLLMAYPHHKLILSLLTVTFMISLGLAVFHLGVENKWWIYDSACTGNAFKAGASVEEMLNSLKAAPIAKCDQAIPFLFGMTMAFYNILTSAFLSMIAAWLLFSRNVIRG